MSQRWRKPPVLKYLKSKNKSEMEVSRDLFIRTLSCDFVCIDLDTSFRSSLEIYKAGLHLDWSK